MRYVFNVHGQSVTYTYKAHPKTLKHAKFRFLFDLNTLTTVDSCVGGQDSFEEN